MEDKWGELQKKPKDNADQNLRILVSKSKNCKIDSFRNMGKISQKTTKVVIFGKDTGLCEAREESAMVCFFFLYKPFINIGSF